MYKLWPCLNNIAFSVLRENVVPTKVIVTTDGTNGCVKGDIWCQRGFWTPWCRTILVRVVGVLQAVSIRGEVTYRVAKELVNMIRPLVDHPPLHQEYQAFCGGHEVAQVGAGITFPHMM